MMDWNDFEAKATQVLPQQELKPKRCWIGVLTHEKSPEDNLVETDFVCKLGHNGRTYKAMLTSRLHRDDWTCQGPYSEAL